MNKATRMAGLATIAAAGAVGTYLYKKPKLRKDLKKAKSANEAMNLVGHELEHDALMVAGKAMDLGSDGLHTISKSLAPRPMAMHTAPHRKMKSAMKRAVTSPKKVQVSATVTKK